MKSGIPNPQSRARIGRIPIFQKWQSLAIQNKIICKTLSRNMGKGQNIWALNQFVKGTTFA